MKITRENFEEICMLYADHELSAEQRAAVDAFVEANPDLRADLELFVSLTLDKNDTVQLDDKSFLFHSEDEISESIREQMLLHLDGELEVPQRTELEARIAQHEKIRQEWDLLQKTRLDASEQLAFPNRAQLYRSEQPKGQVIRFRWVRYAAAAAIILALGLLWLNREAVDPAASPVAGDGFVAEANAENRASNGVPGTVTAPTLESSQNREGPGEPEPAGAALAAGRLAGSASDPSLHKADLPKGSRDASRNPSAEQPAIARLDGSPDRVTETRETSSAIVSTPEQMTSQASIDVSDKAIGEPSFKADYATQALAGDQSNPAFIEVEGPDENRGRKGLRGLVRKANRIFNKVTNPDLDKPLVKATNIQIGVGR